jgi:hemerythrin
MDIGIDAIDAQHRRIVGYINELEAARVLGDRVGISQVLIGLTEYTITHFSFEEELMALADYPVTDEHKRAHTSFATRINRYMEQHESGADVTRRLLSELKLWLSEHIQGEDRLYAPFVKKALTKDWLIATLAKFSILTMFSHKKKRQHP